MGFQLYNPFVFNNPTEYAIPGFVLLIVLEYIFIRKRLRRNYDIREAAASIGMGIGVLFVDLFMMVFVLGLLFWIYQFRIFETLGPETLEELASIAWHREHWYAWVILFILDDLTFYVHHRTAHEIRILWAGHVNHHSSQDYNLATALRQGWWEDVYKYIWWLWLPLLGFHPFMVLTQMALSLIYQFWIHTELIGKLGPLEWVFNTPSHHRVHHGANIKYLDRNYGGILIVWDRLFGTFQEEDEPARYGLTKNINTRNLFRIAGHELAAIWRDVRRAPSLGDKLKYVFLSPGWSHDGPDLRAGTLKKANADAHSGAE